MATAATPARRVELALAGRNGALCAAAVFLVASYLGLTAIALLAAAILCLAGLAWLSAWLSTWRVQYERTLSDRRGFPGDTLTLRVRLANRKPLPVPWLEVAEALPQALLPQDSTGVVRRCLHLPWRSTVRWHYELVCRRRGLYTLAAAELRGGDPYGLAERALAATDSEEVLVYPRLVPLARLGLPARAIFGRQRPPRSLFEDPSRLAGLRDYRPGDPLNRIHWKATARHAALQVKVYEPTTTPQALLLLPLEGYPATPEGEALAEEGISVVASLAHEGAALGWAVGALVNGRPAVAIAPGAGREQTGLVLEGLARLTLVRALSLADLLSGERSQLAAGSTAVFVVAEFAPAVLAAAADLSRAGHAVAFVRVGAGAGGETTVGGWPVLAATAVQGA